MDTLEEVKSFSRSIREGVESSPIKFYTGIIVDQNNQGRLVLPWDPLALEKQKLKPFVTQDIYTERQKFEDLSESIEKFKSEIDISLIGETRATGQKKTYTSSQMTYMIKELGGKIPTGATKADLVKILKSILGVE